MLPQIKVYNIDYDFIISNYTDQKLWKKEWTLFHFKNYIFTLSLNRINVKENSIEFIIKLSSGLDIWNNTATITCDYYIDNMSIDFLKNLIYLKMIKITEWLEERYIESEDKLYLQIRDAREDELQKLREIAENFLDNEGVGNRDIREAYIDKFIDNNEETWSKLVRIKDKMKYSYLTDLYLILATINEDLELKQKIRNSEVKNIADLEAEIKEIADKINSEEYAQDMEANLEAI